MAKKEERWIKVYLRVNVEFTEEGMMLPRSFVWTDGHTYEIDRVLHCKPAPALKAGGQGDRYTIIINGKQSYLFFERSTNIFGNVIGRWFVERKIA